MRVLYLSHVDWSWIKQRPQFLAEALQREGCDVDVRYLPAWRRGVRTGTASADVRVRRLPHLPPAGRFLRWRVNPWLRRVWLTLTARTADVVWITHPSLVTSVPRGLRSRLVYDAMDRIADFPGVDSSLLLTLESQALENAVVTFATSQNIADSLRSRHPSAPVVLLRNALDSAKDWYSAGRRPGDADHITVVYAGTVATWFDVDAIAALRRSHPNWVVRVIGPVEKVMTDPLVELGVETPGPVPHEDLLSHYAKASVLVMPFRVTSLIAGVDPVKLYEYVATGRPVVSVWYDELEHFSGWLTFYRDSQEFPTAVEAALTEAAAARGRIDRFVADNSWRERGARALAVLDDARSDRVRSFDEVG